MDDGCNSTPHASGKRHANQVGSSFSFPKPPLTYGQQVDHLVDRGLVVEDRSFAEKALSETNYYRLRGYWLDLEDGTGFVPDASFEDIWHIHELDRALRRWLWSAIEPVEIKARTAFAYRVAMEAGPMGYMDPSLYLDGRRLEKSLNAVGREVRQALHFKTPCVVHNIEKYGALPSWAMVEVASMGTVSNLYGNLRHDGVGGLVRESVASDFGAKSRLLSSWLHHLTVVRNVCAHHGRVYGRSMPVAPALLAKDRRKKPAGVMPTLLVLARIYQRSWPQEWPSMVDDLNAVFQEHSDVALNPLGVGEGWRSTLLEA